MTSHCVRHSLIAAIFALQPCHGHGEALYANIDFGRKSGPLRRRKTMAHVQTPLQISSNTGYGLYKICTCRFMNQCRT